MRRKSRKDTRIPSHALSPNIFAMTISYAKMEGNFIEQGQSEKYFISENGGKLNRSVNQRGLIENYFINKNGGKLNRARTNKKLFHIQKWREGKLRRIE